MFRFNKKSIMIDKYNTTTRMNYLSNGTFHTMISQRAAALRYKSPQIWRINHYKFSVPTDRSGFYTYRTGKIYGARQTSPAIQSREVVGFTV